MKAPNLILWLFLASSVAVAVFVAELAARAAWFHLVLDRLP